MNKIIILFVMFSSLMTISNAQQSIYDISVNDINGSLIDLNRFKGKYILFVNVASECGFTKQYEGLERLYQNFRDDLIIIGLPCNQFGNQEPDSEEQIKKFCINNFGVSFLLTEKVHVKGMNQHLLYKWLTRKEINGEMSSIVKWNFQKYIVSRDGKLLDYFFSTTKPMSKKITSIIEQ